MENEKVISENISFLFKDEVQSKTSLRDRILRKELSYSQETKQTMTKLEIHTDDTERTIIKYKEMEINEVLELRQETMMAIENKYPAHKSIAAIKKCMRDFAKKGKDYCDISYWDNTISSGEYLDDVACYFTLSGYKVTDLRYFHTDRAINTIRVSWTLN